MFFFINNNFYISTLTGLKQLDYEFESRFSVSFKANMKTDTQIDPILLSENMLLCVIQQFTLF